MVVHDLAQALAAAAAAAELERPLVLLTPEVGLQAQGPGFWAAVQRRLAAEHPGAPVHLLVDGADVPGLAQAALRCGLTWLVVRPGRPAAAGLARLIEAAGGRVSERRPPALDLLDQPDPASAVRALLLGHVTPAGPLK